MAREENLASNWRLLVFLAVLSGAVAILLFQGIRFGIDFEGGTFFQIHLAEKVKDPAKLQQITRVIEQRLNTTGLKDVRVFSFGEEFIGAEIPETDPQEIQRLEALLRRQGRFEARINGETIFTGEGLASVDTQASVPSYEPAQNGFVTWNVPFVLKPDAAIRFRNLTFHQCTPLRAPAKTSADFSCAHTYLFIDRPLKTVLVMPESVLLRDRSLFLAGNNIEGFPQGTKLDTVLENVGAPYFVVTGQALDSNQRAALQRLVGTHPTALVPDSLPEAVRSGLEKMGYEVRVVAEPEDVPWVWRVSGLRSIVRLQPTITGNLPYVEKVEDAEVITNLIITGTEPSQKEATREREETRIILQAGALAVSVDDISRDTISPRLGSAFKGQAVVMGLLVLLAVALVIFLRYRQPQLSAAIMFTAVSEAFLTLAFTSLAGTIDLAAIAGIIAAVGTGVDDQIVISDELLRGASRARLSLLNKLKNAFFMVVGAALTTMATMLPLIVFGDALIKLRGFGIAVMVGVLTGVLVTRPAFGEIARHILAEKAEK